MDWKKIIPMNNNDIVRQTEIQRIFQMAILSGPSIWIPASSEFLMMEMNLRVPVMARVHKQLHRVTKAATEMAKAR